MGTRVPSQALTSLSVRSRTQHRIDGQVQVCALHSPCLARAVLYECPEPGRSTVPGSVVDSRSGAGKHALQLHPRRGTALPWSAAAANGRGLRPLGLVANRVLFGLYHLHKIWAWPSMIGESFGIAWAGKRYRSFWMGVIVHGLEAFFVVLIVAVLAGWYP